MDQQTPNITIADNSKGEVLAIAGGQYRILVSGEMTDDRYAIIEMNVPPGGGPVPHAHPKIEEMFYVAEGEINFKTETGHYTAEKGAFIHIPLNGGVHAFKNQSGLPAKLICTVIPAEIEKLFKEVSIAGPDQAQAINDKYGHSTYPLDYLDERT